MTKSELIAKVIAVNVATPDLKDTIIMYIEAAYDIGLAVGLADGIIQVKKKDKTRIKKLTEALMQIAPLYDGDNSLIANVHSFYKATNIAKVALQEDEL